MPVDGEVITIRISNSSVEYVSHRFDSSITLLLDEESQMCGRYRLSRRKQLIAEYFETDNEVDWEPRYRGCYETRGVMGEQRHL